MEIPIERLADLAPDRRERILKRGTQQLADLAPTVDAIIAAVRARGDAALIEYTARFDHVDLTDLAVPQMESQAALAAAEPLYLAALRQAADAITAFHRAQVPPAAEPAIETTPGVRVWRLWRPIARVGVYIPGGLALYPSTVLMTVIPARLAGSREIVICTPPGHDGHVPANLLAAAAIAGATRVFALGGAQAIAAMAYGTATIPKVDKIVGPGSNYVAAAKQRVAGDCAIDMPAGPSEILIIADETATPAWVAADLLAQAEHGPTSAPVLVTTSPELALAVNAAIREQLTRLATAETIRQSLTNNGAILIADSIEAAILFANDYAAEHLELAIRDPDTWLPRLDHAGSVFLGPWAPEAAGDYATGGNHTLPTAGFARGFGPLSVETFGRWMQAQTATPAGLAGIRATIECLATTEGLPAHAASIRARFDAPASPFAQANFATRTPLAPISVVASSRLPDSFPIVADAPAESATPGLPVRLHANENPYGASPAARAAVASAGNQIGRYPDAAQRAVRSRLATYLGVTPEMVIAGNGSDELLHFITQTELGPDDEVIICEPTFTIYRFEAELVGARIVEVPLDDQFQVDLLAVQAAITPRTKLIWLCSPNNPTGTACNLEILPALLAAGPRIVVDEAYYPFNDLTVLPLLRGEDVPLGAQTLRVDDAAERARLVVVRTMSKIAGLAGLRFGYAIADPAYIARLDRRRHPFNVNTVAEAAALATLDASAWMADIKTAIEAERTRLTAALLALPGVHVWPSAANFLLVALPVEDAGVIARELAARGVLVRHYPQPRLRRALRVTIGTPHENDAFLSTLIAVLAASEVHA